MIDMKKINDYGKAGYRIMIDNDCYFIFENDDWDKPYIDGGHNTNPRDLLIALLEDKGFDVELA